MRIRSDGTIEIKDGITAPSSTTSGFSGLYIDTADGNFKIRFNSGTIKTIATDP